eukprot:TRINITY_DN20192_c0_g2_i1.p1 TRINITY_DN20192_c0_g2~~TRINITY_DN20192_c0_g2_i1.p1  ORF type:complete len:125 (+),score=7.42 TRINITY_DN20192_c0_g2_i1:27-377(+)
MAVPKTKESKAFFAGYNTTTKNSYFPHFTIQNFKIGENAFAHIHALPWATTTIPRLQNGFGFAKERVIKGVLTEQYYPVDDFGGVIKLTPEGTMARVSDDEEIARRREFYASHLKA